MKSKKVHSRVIHILLPVVIVAMMCVLLTGCGDKSETAVLSGYENVPFSEQLSHVAEVLTEEYTSEGAVCQYDIRVEEGWDIATDMYVYNNGTMEKGEELTYVLSFKATEDGETEDLVFRFSVLHIKNENVLIPKSIIITEDDNTETIFNKGEIDEFLEEMFEL